MVWCPPAPGPRRTRAASTRPHRDGHNVDMVMLSGGPSGRSGALVDAAVRLAPALILLLLAATSLAVLGAAGSTLGYDFQAYAQAADRLLAGQPLTGRRRLPGHLRRRAGGPGRRRRASPQVVT